MSIDKLRQFIIEGSYQRMRQAEEQISLLRQSIREEQDKQNQKILVWEESGVIGKFVLNKTYEYNHLALNVLLFDLGILPVVSMIDRNKLTSAEIQVLEVIQDPSLSYVRFSPAQHGDQRTFNNVPIEIQELSLPEKVGLWKRNYIIFSDLHQEWQMTRASAAKSGWLQPTYKFELGTLSKHDLPMAIRTIKAHGLINSERILQCAKVDHSHVADYIVKGLLTKSELNKCRKITGVQRKYILTIFEKEYNKQIYLQQRSLKLTKQN
ncbi:hypothetical protein HQN89_30910 [Paenibacillus frigoriresistens]|uniref:hypothetical protein n=1 Tax=Paenibacillus alginolyticus TaxID=59839 RepID=UPI0015656B85|nr:hypothetical protein [Paenibacillus frigoriresistens]NRF95293.1 hypothetical protein [Paenibacillus frigoriresistens]